MKALLLALLCVSSQALATAAPGTLYYWTLDNTLSEAFGGPALTQVGTVPFATGTTPAPPAPNTHWAGPFTDANYLSNTAASFPQGEGSIAYTLSSDGGFKCPWIVGIDANNRINGLTFGGNLYVQYIDSGGSERSMTYGISNNTLYYVIVNWSASSVSLWVGTTTANITKRAENTTNVRKTYTPTLMYIGRTIPLGQAWGGYIGQFRVLTTNISAWPVDTAATSAPARFSPYLFNGPSNRMAPLW